MRRKPLYWLLAVLGALAVAYAGARWLRGGGARAAATDAFDLAALEPERLDSVVIARPGDTVRLVRSAAGWQVGRWPADSARIEDLWRATGEADATELVARSPANHARLGVTDSAATRVIFYGGGAALRELLIGGSGPSWPSAYAREPGAAEVYLLPGELSNLARRGADEWRNRRVASFDPLDADRVILARGADTVTLERTDTTWTVAADSAAPAPADSAAVRRAVEGLSRLSSAGFAPDSIVGLLDFSAPVARVTVLDEDGTALSDLAFVEKAEGAYYVKRAQGPDVWELSEFSVEDFLRSAEQYRRKGAPAP